MSNFQSFHLCTGDHFTGIYDIIDDVINPGAEPDAIYIAPIVQNQDHKPYGYLMRLDTGVIYEAHCHVSVDLVFIGIESNRREERRQAILHEINEFLHKSV